MYLSVHSVPHTATTITIIMSYSRDLPIVWIGRNNDICTLYIGLQSGRRLLGQVLRLLHTRTLHYKIAINVYNIIPGALSSAAEETGSTPCRHVCDAVWQTPIVSFSGENVLRRETVLRLLSSTRACGCQWTEQEEKIKRPSDTSTYLAISTSYLYITCLGFRRDSASPGLRCCNSHMYPYSIRTYIIYYDCVIIIIISSSISPGRFAMTTEIQ